MIAIRMTVGADGSPNGHTVYTYHAGEVYSPDSEPPASESLMAAFVASKRAVEVDASGNPIGMPASKRATKSDTKSDAKAIEKPAAEE